ncbi:MAG: sulfatase-like hydrolase/transferase, partial [Planctomycetota bacterium]
KATYAAMIAYLDEHVGAVVDTLDELGLTDDTLVIFTSDNGPAKEGGAAPANFNSSGGLRGYKRDLYEGGIRVPFIAKWPGRIEAGAESDFTGAFWDMMPTLAELAGSEAPEGLDGVSFVPTLTGEGTQAEPDYLYWEFHDKGGRVALRRGDWKVVRYNALKQPNAPVELYNVVEDPFETNDVARQYGDLADELTALMESARTESDVFPFTERGRAAGRRGL